MSKKIRLIPHDTIEEWHDKIRRIRDNEHKFKMLIIEKILSNPDVTAKEIQDTFFISYRTMKEWVEQYNKGGLEGLKAKNPKGRGSGKGNSKVPDEVYYKLIKEIDKNPNKKWTLKAKQAFIKKECGIEVTEASISYRMRKIN